jgi:hypothetical protein
MFRRTTDLDISIEDGCLVIDGAVLEEILAEVHRRLGADAQILSADRNVVGGLGGFFGSERFHVVAAPPVAAEGESTPEAGDDAETVDGPSFAAALAEALSNEMEIDLDELAAPAQLLALEPEMEFEPEVEPELEPESQPASSPVDASWPPPWPDSRPQPAPAMTLPPIDPLPMIEATLPEIEPEIEPEPVAQPAAVGLPEPLELLGLSDVPIGELLGRTERRTPPGTSAPPGVVAVVGDAEDAAATVRQLAAQHGQASSAVVLLAPDLRARDSSRVVITSLALVAEQRTRWATRAGTTFVAVALDPGETGRAWVGEALRVLDPAQVRYAAPAWRSVDELRDRVAAIGRVDCVDLVETGAVPRPTAAVLRPPAVAAAGRPGAGLPRPALGGMG